MYNGLIQMPTNIYRAVIYIRLSEADEGRRDVGIGQVELCYYSSLHEQVL